MVDTLFDLKLTAEMLAAYRASIPAAKEIGILVNTHADGDHTFGNQLVEGARIIATQGTVDDFARFDPAVVQKIVTNADQYGSAGVFMKECFRPFDFSGIELTPPTATSCSPRAPRSRGTDPCIAGSGSATWCSTWTSRLSLPGTGRSRRRTTSARCATISST
jgi:hypothetical protein